MISWVVLAVFTFVLASLGFVGYHFSVRTLRCAALVTATVLVSFITWYGLTHPAQAPPDLASSFTRGADELSAAFFAIFLRLQPPGHHVPAPGRVGWLVITVTLVFGYRELEAWAMRWQAPMLDTSALGDGQPSIQLDGVSGKSMAGVTDGQRHDQLVAELRFRLAAMEVRAPAIMPGGTRSNALASIAEASGVSGSSLASAIIRFFGALWPNPRQFRLRVWMEPKDAGRTKATVDLDDPRTGVTIATKTLVASSLDEAATMVAGYVAQQIFSADPTTPPWCFGTADGSDLGGLLLARQERVFVRFPADIEHSRNAQIKILEKVTGNNRCAGVVNYELAQLYDLGYQHLAALWLHAVNREQYPRFYRGRYRFGMSLEMVANPGFTFTKTADAERQLDEILDILNRCDGRTDLRREPDSIISATGSSQNCALSPSLSMALLAAAQKELGAVRRQLTVRHVIWAALVHRDERAVRRPYWRLRTRQGFRDGVCVAELLVAVRRRLNNHDWPGAGEKLPRINLAMRIVAAIAGDAAPIRSIFGNPGEQWRQEPAVPQSKRAMGDRVRWLPRRCRMASWQAAYNTACLYAALAREDLAQERRVVTSLKRAINNGQSEMERPWDWISHDPDFLPLKSSTKKFACFNQFLGDQKMKDYPQAARRPDRVGAGEPGT
jgi:hypothetical protein